MQNLIRILEFLKPNPVKLLFLVEWVLLVFFELVTGQLTSTSLLVALPPLAFLYLLGSLLYSLSQRTRHIVQGIWIHWLALGLALADQLLKTVINLALPYQASLPVIPGWFHIANERNPYGSWLLATLEINFLSTTMLAVFVLLFLSGTWIGYGYYNSRQPSSVWVDMTYLGLFAGLLSALCDLTLRGYTLDYLNIPGIVTADLKDLYLTLAIAAFFAEIYANPAITLRWRGWRKETQARRQLTADLIQYTRQECRRLWHRLAQQNKGKPPP